MNRLKLLGDRIMSRDPDRQTAEIQIRIAIMNRCSILGRAKIKAGPEASGKRSRAA
ncbi:hypothetical protein ICN82_12565 [Mangrovicoccus sp. HB182678]|uniref:Uncharacterized protein n=1 Tax=Mangrovicoccus algicola TaxID=2771008 RepID=A0A8J6YZV4_9RHOB|nr:hypothetical protein [Mangrovicoccus algicola]